jgi:NADH:ubiquinone reductase (non-electrogenic)
MTFGIPGVREHAHFLKELEDGIAIQRDLLKKLELASALVAAAAAAPAPAERARLNAEVDRLLSWVVIGGGPTGVELTAELTDFARQDVARYFPALAPRVKITLVEAADRVLGVFDAALAASATATLGALGARVACGAAVTRITPEAVEFRRTRGDGPPGAIAYGTCVWAGGVARRPVVEAFARRFDPAGAVQSSRHGLLVDAWFRVKGVADRSVFALGDCAVSGCAPTAQAAVQQGRFLGRAFRDSLATLAAAEDPAAAAAPVAPFRFRPRGALAYTGNGTGVAEVRKLELWDAYPAGAAASTNVDGAPAFFIWRSLYFSSILSFNNQARVMHDWVKAAVFGRDISTPFVEGGRAPTGGKV